MKNTTLFIISILLISIITGFIFFNSKISVDGQNNKVSGQLNNNEVQIVKLSVKNSEYILNPSSIKKGTRIRLEADMNNMPGCSKAVVIPGFGISKIFTSTDNTIEFIADKAGTFNIMCSMNMYRGSFTILESDGTKSNYVETKSSNSATGTCGGSNGGGCGCMS